MKKQPGRPRNPDKPEQFSIRLPPKLKFGLELLARAQHRSLSQAVEWALQVGLNNYEVGYNGDTIPTIGSIVEKAWSHDHEADRLRVIYNQSPTLLSFEDFKACELVERSREWEKAEDMYGGLKTPTQGENNEEHRKESEERRRERKEIYDEFVRALWPLIRPLAVSLANSGLSTQEVSIRNQFSTKYEGVGKGGLGDFAWMKSMSLVITHPEFSDTERFDIALELDKKYPNYGVSLDELAKQRQLGIIDAARRTSGQAVTDKAIEQHAQQQHDAKEAVGKVAKRKGKAK